MEAGTIGRSLLRSQSAVRSTLLCRIPPPSARPSHSAIKAIAYQSPHSLAFRSRRAFTTVPQRQQPVEARTPQDRDQNSRDQPSDQQSTANKPFTTSPSGSAELNDLLAFAKSPISSSTRTGTTRYKSSDAQGIHRDGRPYPSTTPGMNPSSTSLDGLLSSFPTPSASGRGSGQNRPSANAARSSFGLDSLLRRNPNERNSRANAGTTVQQQELPKSIRLGAALGRTIKVDSQKGVDLRRGLIQLNMLVNRNRIAQELHKQKFHERPGLRRKRLHRERWRKKFSAGFVGVLQRVQHMRRQGW